MALSKTLALSVALLAVAFVAAAQQAMTYTYDQLGRISTVTYVDGKQIVYRYDAAGNRTQHIVSATTVNKAPVAVDDTRTATEGLAFTFDPRTNDSDPDGNPLTVASVSNGEFGTASVTGGGTTITYTPTNGRVASDLITYSISDGNLSSSASVTMTIANGPPSPVADAISVNRGANPGLTFDPRTNDADPGMDPFTVTNKTNGTKGAVTIGSGGTSVTYKPNAAVFGADSFTYTVTDDQGASATGTVNVDIVFVNTGPTAVNDSAYKRATSSANMWVQLDPRFNDSDPQGDVLTVTAKTNGAYGTVSILNAGTAVKYQRTSNFPPAGQTRNDTFTYTITETYGLTATATVTVTIDNIPNDPMCGGSPC